MKGRKGVRVASRTTNLRRSSRVNGGSKKQKQLNILTERGRRCSDPMQTGGDYLGNGKRIQVRKNSSIMRREHIDNGTRRASNEGLLRREHSVAPKNRRVSKRYVEEIWRDGSRAICTGVERTRGCNVSGRFR